MKYYLGIDGGGTKTVAAVSDENGNIITKKTGRSINFYSVGMEGARRNLADVIAMLYEEIGECRFAGAYIGCSALDAEADAALTERLCGGIVDAEKLKLHSDVYIALGTVGEAEHPCVAICGTGSIAVALDKNGNTVVSGGWGHIIGDEGSAYAVALRAIRLCCIACDKGEETPLLKKSCEYFGVDDFRLAIDKIYSPATTKDVIAGFARHIGELAMKGEREALAIMTSEAEAFAQTVLILLEKTGCCDALGLSGGVFRNNRAFAAAFCEKIKAEYPDIKIRLAEIPPEECAASLAREL